jgi:DNA-binding MarR family transcriptional regulator
MSTMFCYCAASRRLSRLLTARYDAALSAAGLTAAQFEALSRLSARGPSNGRVLAQQLALDKTTLSRNLKTLLESGLVEAAPGEDARTVVYALSTAGRKRLAKAMPLWQGAHDASLAMLGSQAAASQRALERMNLNLR